MGCKETDINRLGRWFHDNASEICRKHYLRNVPLQAAICMSGEPTGEYYRIPRAASIEIGNIEKLRNDEDFSQIITHLVPELLEKAALAETAFCRPNEIPDEKSLFRHPPQISIFFAVLRQQWQRLFKTRLL